VALRDRRQLQQDFAKGKNLILMPMLEGPHHHKGGGEKNLIGGGKEPGLGRGGSVKAAVKEASFQAKTKEGGFAVGVQREGRSTGGSLVAIKQTTGRSAENKKPGMSRPSVHEKGDSA